MIYEFKCRATGTVVMTQQIAEHMLGIIGKEPAAKGVILPAQMPEAIRALEAAVELDREEERKAREHPKSASEEAELDDEERQPVVSLGQRAWPFIEMLRSAAAADREITWGV